MEKKPLGRAIEELSIANLELELRGEELMATDEKFYRSQSVLRKFFEEAPLPILRVTPGGFIQSCNNKAANLILSGPYFFYKDITRAWEDQLSPKMKKIWLEFLQESVEKGGSEGKEIFISHPGSSGTYLDLLGTFDKESQTIIVYFLDTTLFRNQKQEFVFLSSFASHLGQSYVFTDPDRRVVWVSPSFHKLTGYSLEEVRGRSLSLLQGPDTCQETVKRIREHLNKRQRVREEILNYTKNGSPYWILLEILPRYDNQKNLLGFVSVQTDITSIKQREIELKELRTAFNLSPTGIIITDEAGKTVFCNKACEIITGYSLEELLGKPPPILRDSHPLSKEVWECLRNGQLWVGEAHTFNKHGKLFWEKIIAAPLTHNGQPSGFSIVKIDISKEKEHAEKIKHFQEILENTKNPVVITDREKKILWANNAYQALTEWSLSEIQGKSPKILQGEKTCQNTVKEIQEHLSKGLPYQGEILNYTKSGKPFWIKLEIHPRYNEQREIVGWYSIQTDISSLKEREKLLEEAKHSAEEALKLKKNLLTTINHEIRTPLNAIVGLSRILQTTQDLQKQQDLINILNFNCQSLLSVVNQALDLTKLEEGKMEVRHQVFSCKELLESICQSTRFRAEEKGLQFHCDIEEGFPEFIESDPDKLLQILNNLTNNALKFTEKGGITLRARVNRDISILSITIEDSGMGIPKDKIGLIFQPFTQLNPQIPGSGLGLSICQKLVEKLGGHISVESVINKGSAFHVEIPFREPQGNVPLPPPSQKHSLQGKVLLVEDYTPNQLVIEHFLRDMGLEVKIADSLGETYRFLNQEAFDLILLDLQLPDGHGREGATNIRKANFPFRNSEIPIIVLTAHSLEEEATACRQAGIQGFLTKPITPEELQSQITMFLKDKKQSPIFSREAFLNNFNGNLEFARNFRDITIQENDKIFQDLQRRPKNPIE